MELDISSKVIDVSIYILEICFEVVHFEVSLAPKFCFQSPAAARTYLIGKHTIPKVISYRWDQKED